MSRGTSAEGRTRTCTGVASQGILSPLRLPISPPRPTPAHPGLPHCFETHAPARPHHLDRRLSPIGPHECPPDRRIDLRGTYPLSPIPFVEKYQHRAARRNAGEARARGAAAPRRGHHGIKLRRAPLEQPAARLVRLVHQLAEAPPPPWARAGRPRPPAAGRRAAVPAARRWTRTRRAARGQAAPARRSRGP